MYCTVHSPRIISPLTFLSHPPLPSGPSSPSTLIKQTQTQTQTHLIPPSQLKTKPKTSLQSHPRNLADTHTHTRMHACNHPIASVRSAIPMQEVPTDLAFPSRSMHRNPVVQCTGFTPKLWGGGGEACLGNPYPPAYYWKQVG